MRFQRAVCAVVVAALGLASGARGQIGDGWIEEFPRLCLHHAADGTLYNVCPAPGYFDDGLCHYDNDGAGTESFYLYNHRSNRIEIRAHNDYQSGMKQFEGWVWIEPPTNNESIMQIFGSPGPNATTAMFRAFDANGGEIRYYSSPSQAIASGIYGTWTRVNVIHDADGGWVYAYINGSLAGQWRDRGVSTHYFKYGAYGTHNDATPAYVWWYGVRFFRQ
jgi:hypothetical protein